MSFVLQELQDGKENYGGISEYLYSTIPSQTHVDIYGCQEKRRKDFVSVLLVFLSINTT